MPLIKIEFDNEKVSNADALVLSEAIQKIVSEATDIEDVFVYANTSQIKVKVAPIEVFVEMSGHKINDADVLVQDIRNRLSQWKKEQSYPHPINLTLVPMNWKIEIGI